MADAVQILTLQRMKRELSIELSVADDDNLLVGHSIAAVTFCTTFTGLDIEGMALADVPETFVQACVICVRLFYDGVADIRPTSTLLHLLAPLRVWHTRDEYPT